MKPAISSINSRRRRLLLLLLLFRRRKEINHVKQTLVAESGGKFGRECDHFLFPNVVWLNAWQFKRYLHCASSAQSQYFVLFSFISSIYQLSIWAAVVPAQKSVKHKEFVNKMSRLSRWHTLFSRLTVVSSLNDLSNHYSIFHRLHKSNTFGWFWDWPSEIAVAIKIIVATDIHWAEPGTERGGGGKDGCVSSWS